MQSLQIPRNGMMVKVRNRRGVISSVSESNYGTGISYMVRVDYLDTQGSQEETLLWDVEEKIGARLFEPINLPNIEDSAKEPFTNRDFDALVRSARWSSLNPIPSLVGKEEGLEEIVTAPFFGAIQVDDYQMEPLFRAMKMPRVSLLIADDVGLGKTIEAGLVLTELIRKRRIQKILILTPASLRDQWKNELWKKFSLSFEVVDRETTQSLRKDIGLEANPWKAHSRILTSYHYLKQRDILEQFHSSFRQTGDSPILPWDLLIVDEAHNVMPPPMGEESELTKMVRAISPYFEHKIFLTATPHNGYTESFTGLLELLDPVKYVKTNELTDEQIQEIWRTTGVRRLKREINELDKQMGNPQRFAERSLSPLHLHFSAAEKQLFESFAEFKKTVYQTMRESSNVERNLGFFVLEILNKRLLSSTTSFADSWSRFKLGWAEEESDSIDLNTTKRHLEEETSDDKEYETRISLASTVGGGWIKKNFSSLETSIQNIDNALQRLGLENYTIDKIPTVDTRIERLFQLIQEALFNRGTWIEGERLILFTEYKTTQDYIYSQLIKKYPADTIGMLFGNMDKDDRVKVQSAFNDPKSALRILIATDAASEGLNLQETAHRLLHFDIPWNPSRLEQRNGRLDRHGQANDVIVYHFTSETEADLKFLARVVEKSNTMREDLGLIGELFDRSFQRRFQSGDDSDRIISDLETNANKARKNNKVETLRDQPDYRRYIEAMDWIRKYADLSPESLLATVDTALCFKSNPPKLIEDANISGKYRIDGQLKNPWKKDVEESLSINDSKARPAVTFRPEFFLQKKGDRLVFRDSPDTVMLHLGHNLFHKILNFFNEYRFPDPKGEHYPRRWTARKGEIPNGQEAVLYLTIEEMAINQLREPIHHWVRTICLPIKDKQLLAPLPEVSASELYSLGSEDSSLISKSRELWLDVEQDVKDFLITKQKDLQEKVEQYLKENKQPKIEEEKRLFDYRRKILEKAKKENSLQKLEKDIQKISEKIDQGYLFIEDLKSKEKEKQVLEDEKKRREEHYDRHLEYLDKEKKRILEKILPDRWTLSGKVMVYPVGLEFRFKD